CFAEKTRSRARILRHSAVDNLESNLRVQHRVASYVGDGHCSRAELDRKTIRTHFHLKVCVSQWSGRSSTRRRWSFRFFAVREKAKANQTTQAFAFRTYLSQRPSTCRARLASLRMGVRSSKANAFVVHA